MIVRLSGRLLEVGEESVVMDRDGVAREVLVPRFAVAELAACRGQEVLLHTMEFYEGNSASGHLIPRMLGFLHVDDRAFFERFIQVKGIGPRKALKALSEPVRSIATWIESSDVKSLARLSGIGPRAADLIVASLRGKLDDLVIAGAQRAEAVSQFTTAQRDGLEILVSLGDSRQDVERWLARAAQLQPDLVSAEQWVRAAYQIKTGVSG